MLSRPIRLLATSSTFFFGCLLGRPLAAATFTVATDAASGPGSFRQAVMDAAAVPAGTSAEIVFDPVFFEVPRTVVLDELLPVVRRSLVIDGPPLSGSGEPMVTVSGDKNMSGTIDQGDVAGLRLELQAEGSLTVRRMAFSGCRSTANPGGAIFFRPSGPALLVIENCLFSGNVGRWGGAVSLSGEGHQATLRDTVFTANQAAELDGGALHLGATPALIERCTFRQNSGLNGGAIDTFHGAVELRECLFDSNEARGNGRGGAVYARLGLRVTACTFVGNRARAGGALFLNDMLAPAPGGFIENSTFSSNVATAAPGGAIYAISADLMLRQCTLTLNHANANGAPDLFASGGGIAVPAAANVNRVRLHNCVVAANRLGGPGPASGTDLHGPAASFISLGGNIIGIGESLASVFAQPGDGSGSVAAPLEPMLAPLAPNGGPLPTHIPDPASPVIDIGVPGPDPVIVVDQRGLPRPGGAAPDAGAVELVTLGYPAWAEFLLSGLESPLPNPGGSPILTPLQQPDADPDGDGVPNIREYLAGTDPRTPSWDALTRVHHDPVTGHFTVRYLMAAHVPPGTVEVSFELSETTAHWSEVNPTPPSQPAGFLGTSREMEVVFPGLTTPTHFVRLSARLLVPVGE